MYQIDSRCLHGCTCLMISSNANCPLKFHTESTSLVSVTVSLSGLFLFWRTVTNVKIERIITMPAGIEITSTKLWILALWYSVIGIEEHAGRPEMLPQRPLLWRNQFVEALRNSHPVGRGPSNLLYDTSSVDRLSMLPMDEGMLPLNWLWERLRSSRSPSSQVPQVTCQWVCCCWHPTQSADFEDYQ